MPAKKRQGTLQPALPFLAKDAPGRQVGRVGRFFGEGRYPIRRKRGKIAHATRITVPSETGISEGEVTNFAIFLANLGVLGLQSWPGPDDTTPEPA